MKDTKSDPNSINKSPKIIGTVTIVKTITDGIPVIDSLTASMEISDAPESVNSIVLKNWEVTLLELNPTPPNSTPELLAPGTVSLLEIDSSDKPCYYGKIDNQLLYSTFANHSGVLFTVDVYVNDEKTITGDGNPTGVYFVPTEK